MLLRYFLFFIFMVVTAHSQEPAEPLIEAQVSAKSFYMGQAFSYSILIDGSNKVKPPYINNIPGFAVRKTEERALQSANKSGYVLRYDLIPLESGTLLIPGFPLEVNGKEYSTKEIKINARQPEAHPGLKLSILVSQNEVYVGEPFLLTFIWESEIPLYNLKAVDVKLPLIQDTAFRSILPFNAVAGGSKDTIGLPVSNIRMICSHEIFVKDGKRTEILKFQKVVMARYSGEFSLKPATLLCSFIPPDDKAAKNQKNQNWRPNYPSYFNNDFFEKTGDVVHERYISRSNSIDLKVKDLPLDGRPDDFYGIVGKCDVSAKADQVVMEAGAPLHVTIDISGYDFPSTLKLPDLAKLSTFNRNFSIPNQKSFGEYEKSTKRFTQTLRPLRTDVAVIPPVRIPYFDPQTGTYNVAQSKEIPITVKPAGKVTAFDAELSSEANLKNRLINSPQGIRHNKLDASEMSHTHSSLLTKILLAFFIPLILFTVFVLATAKTRQKLYFPAAYKAKQALAVFRSSSANDLANLEKATRQYFADKLNIAADAHTLSELNEKLNLPKDEAQTLRELYEAFNFNRFNKDALNADLKQLKTQAHTLIKNIDGRLKHV